MIRTPLGQWINPDKINYLQVTIGQQLKEGTSPYTPGNWINKYIIVADIVGSEKYAQISKLYETQEEAQSELDKMFGKNESSEIIDLELFIANTNIKLQKWKSEIEYVYLEYDSSNISKWCVTAYTDYFYYSTFKEAIEKFNSIKI
jgi:hypothetical protein